MCVNRRIMVRPLAATTLMSRASRSCSTMVWDNKRTSLAMVDNLCYREQNSPVVFPRLFIEGEGVRWAVQEGG